MKNTPGPVSNHLRQKAEELLKNKPARNRPELSEAEALRLIHELEVHQIELEMQNEELILAKKQAADAASDKYAKLFDFAPTGYFTLNQPGEITGLNHRGAALLGMERSLLLKFRFDHFVTDDTKPAFSHLLDKIFKSAVKETCEVTLTTSDKIPRYVVLHAIADENKECLVTVIDITERRKTEELLKKSERFLKETQEIALLGSYTIDFKESTWFGTEMLYKVLGVKPDFNKSFEGWMSIIHPEWRLVMREYFDQEIILRKQKFDKEYKIIRPSDKCERWVHAIGRIEFDERNQPLKLAGIIRDITESKLAEEKIHLAHSRLRRFIDSDIVGIIIADAEGKVIETNENYLKIIGYSRADFEAGLVDWRKLTPPEWLYTDEKAIKELRENGKCTPYEKEYLRKDGSRIVVLITDAMLPGPDEQIAGFILDITERKKAELALRESEYKYRELIENSPDAIVIYVDGKIVFANKECARLIRVDKPEKLIGIPVMEFVHPDSRMIVEERMIQASETNVVLPLMEEKFIRPDGTDVLVEVKAISMKFENKHAVQLIIRDITKRKEAEAQLLRNSKFTEALLESIPIPLFFKDANGLYLGCNEAFCLQMGVTSEGIKGKSVMDLWPSDQANIYLQNDLDLIANPTHQIYESTITDKYSQVRDVILAKNVFYDELGQIAGMVGTFNDITERKQAEKVLREAEERNKALFEANPDMMLLLDENRKIIDFQASIQAQPYSPPESFIGKNIADVLPAEVVELINSQMGKLFETEQMQICNYQLLVNDHPRYYENRLVLCGDSKALSIVRDVTELKQTEDELRNSELNFRELFEANTDGIVIYSFDKDGSSSHILDMNGNAAKFAGYTKEEYWLLTHNDLENDITQEELDRRKQELVSKGISRFETIIKHKDGHEINAEIKILLINYGNQPALMSIVRDITDRKNSEIQLQKYAIELSKQIAEKDKFFSIIAHDLRGPFNGFLELTEMMASGSSGLLMEDIQKIAGIMKKSATNLFRLLSNLLEWSRMQRGITTYNPMPVILSSKIQELTSLAEEAASKKGITIIYSIPADLVVFADENMLEGILRNIVTNAVKYSNTGGSITVSANYISGDTVEFSIKDNGIGMSATIVDNLFNLNVNTSRKGTAGELSTGLGLMICKDFIEKHHGILRIESELGKGSTFFFTIPGRIKSTSPITGSDPATDNLLDQDRKLTILIAEDEEISDLLISIALAKISRETYHAKTGLEAIDICRVHPETDLILMDIKMPEMDGYEATRQIRRFNKNVIIIAQTAYTYSNDREKALEAGCNDYIAKPISQAELMEIIRKYIR